MATAPASKMTVQCDCGAKLKVPTSAEGKKAKCPKCGNAFRIQKSGDDAPSAKSIKTAASPGDSGDMGSILNALATQANNAPAIETEESLAPPVLCIKCGRMVPSSSEACVHCGSNIRQTGAARSSIARPGPAHSSFSVIDAMPQSLAFGCVLSALGACLGAGIWFLVCKTTGYEVGYIACAVGFLAGGGMLLGNRQEDDLAAIIAAGMAVGGIVLARILFISFLIGDFTTEARNDIDYQRGVVATVMAFDALQNGNPSDQAAWESELDNAYEQVGSMPENDVRNTFQSRESDFKNAVASNNLVSRHADTEGLDLDALGESKWEFLKETFDPLDIIFFLIATVAAFKVAGISKA